MPFGARQQQMLLEFVRTEGPGVIHAPYTPEFEALCAKVDGTSSIESKHAIWEQVIRISARPEVPPAAPAATVSPGPMPVPRDPEVNGPQFPSQTAATPTCSTMARSFRRSRGTRRDRPIFPPNRSPNATS